MALITLEYLFWKKDSSNFFNPSDAIEDMLHVHHRGTLTKAQKHFILLPLQVELVHFQKGFKFLPVNVV